ncbi:hypothetical protein [Paenibacillus lignilyticus]|uniref:Uncharacterized protein n=1 Tax=Paenibacillus lignilyticus TaxID=1172615 RepID=A0ABS5CJ10_9BACL|nr:hypothetical protein [Paenibacillus lignilyticus]MBP3965880.1 hypothetical protein [Paenibacillus lignilyticus]
MMCAQFNAGSLSFCIDKAGNITRLTDTAHGGTYDAADQGSPLLRIVINEEIERPSSAVYDDEEGKLSLFFESSGVQVDVNVVSKGLYTSFEVARIIEAIEKHAIDAVIWGPFETTVSGSIGESVGIVHNPIFAIGLLSLNAKTIGGWPSELKALAFADGLYEDGKFEYRLSTAWPTKEGSLLQAYARNRTKGGTRPVWGINDIEVAPLENEDAAIVGSKVALFGCGVEHVLETIEEIELSENLPHPTIEGVWGKVSPAATQSYLIINFTEETTAEAIRYTKQAGLKYMYHPDPFATWGHFVLKPESFPNGDEGLRASVAAAESAGVHVGVHTLSNFTTLNDSYVTPEPDKRLQTVGTARLIEAVSEAETAELIIDNPKPFLVNLYRTTAIIGNELIEYGSISESAPWKLLDVKRGVNGTIVAEHEAGAEICRLWDHPYNVFFPNVELQDEYSDRIGELFRNSGLKQISFDGLEGCYATGQDDYGVNRFVKRCYDGWNKEVINDASIVVSNYAWHIFTRFNWGEPWGVATREGQLEWRLSNQRYFERNFIPPMLGWFLIRSASNRFEATTSDEIEWVLSKAAGFNAGFALSAEMAVLRRNGNSDKLLENVSSWERARQIGAFSPDQRERMKDPTSDWHLEKLEEDRWSLYLISLSAPLVCSPEELQPGQPGGADWPFFNMHEAQPLRFSMRVLSAYGNEEGYIKRPTICMNGQYMTFETEVRAGEYLVCDGDRVGQIMDRNWNVLRTAQASSEPPIVRAGSQTISFSCKFEGEPKPSVSVKVSTRSAPESVNTDWKLDDLDRLRSI